MTTISPQELTEGVNSFRELLANRGVALDPEALLSKRLNDVDAFLGHAQDIQPGATGAAQDDLALRIGGDLLEMWHLFEAVQSLTSGKVAHLIETLRTLAAFRVGMAEHEAQMTEAAYELYAASEFMKAGFRPSFVDTRRPSRFQQRVEFLLRHKWPVECKKPRNSARLLARALDGADKINEREQPGIVSLNLNSLVYPEDGSDYWEVDSSADLWPLLGKPIGDWLDEHSEELRADVLSEHVRAIVMDFSVVAYYHDSTNISVPTMRLALTSNDIIRESVLARTIAHVEG